MKAFLLIIALVYSSFAIDDEFLAVDVTSASGSDHVGATITVQYTNGAEEVGFWENVTIDYGQAFSDNFSLTFQGDNTFPVDLRSAFWTFEARAPVRRFTFDLSTDAAFWDIVYVGNTTNIADLGTPFSGDGQPYRTVIIENNPDSEAPDLFFYSGVPTFSGRQDDAWYVLTVEWTAANYPRGFQGILKFQADTDRLMPTRSPNDSCVVLPTIGPLQAIFVPDYVQDTQPPAFYTDASGNQRVHIEFWSFAATNRRTGVDERFLTWIYFGSQPGSAPLGCRPNEDYFWQFSRRTNENGACIDVYTLDWTYEEFVNNCPVDIITDVCGVSISGVITVRTITDRVQNRLNLTITSAGNETSQHGFILDVGDCVSSTNEIRVYAPIEITAVIDEYTVPAGDSSKFFFFRTLIQDPQYEGFRLIYEGGVTQIRDAMVVSDPSVEDRRLRLEVVEQTSGCITTNFTVEDGPDVQLCTQRFLLKIDPLAIMNESLCRLKDVFINVPFRIVCNNPDPLLCPLENSTYENSTSSDHADIVLWIDTQEFCPITISTYTARGRFNVYRSDFRARASSFFSNQTIGLEFVLDGPEPENIAAIRVTYLAGVLSPESDDDLYPPNVYDVISEPGRGAILIGAQPPAQNRSSDVNLQYWCPSYPRPNPPSPGCPNNVVRFTLFLNSAIWPIEIDSSNFLRFGISVEFDLVGGAKKNLIGDVVVQIGESFGVTGTVTVR